MIVRAMCYCTDPALNMKHFLKYRIDNSQTQNYFQNDKDNNNTSRLNLSFCHLCFCKVIALSFYLLRRNIICEPCENEAGGEAVSPMRVGGHTRQPAARLCRLSSCVTNWSSSSHNMTNCRAATSATSPCSDVNR